MGKRIDGDELGALAGGGGEGGDTAFKSCDALFKDIDGGLWRKLANYFFTFFFFSQRKLSVEGLRTFMIRL